MGLTKRRDSYYVEFPVIDDGKVLVLAASGGKLKRWKVGCLDKKIAKTQEALIRTRLLTGQEISPVMERAQSVTFSEFAALYLQTEKARAAKSPAILYEVASLVQFFGTKPLTSITEADVVAFREWRSKRVRGAEGTASVQTVNHEHSRLITMMNVARSKVFGLLIQNPAAEVERPNPHNERDRVASLDEWLGLMQHAAPHLRRVLTVAYDLGPRRGELFKLEWADVDMKQKEFTLRRTKNNKTRTVPMTPAVYQAFCEAWQERRLDTAHVFLYEGGPIKSIRTAFKAACKRAGVKSGRKNGGLTVHDFRHTASTNLRRAGVDTMTAMQIVGHKSEAMHRRYNTITPDDMHKAVARLSLTDTSARASRGNIKDQAEKQA